MLDNGIVPIVETMIQTIAITEAITSLNEVEQKFNLTRSNEPNFFREWQTNLPELNKIEKQALNSLKERYFYYAADNTITEGTLNIIIISLLLEIVHLCDPPFKIKAEQAVKVDLKNEDIVLQGFIDALVVKNQFWLVVIEAKRYGFNVSYALPQALAYMMANPHLNKPVFGMVTNGEDYIFVKLDQQSGYYDFSDKLTLSKRSNEDFYQVLQMIKRIKELLLNSVDD